MDKTGLEYIIYFIELAFLFIGIYYFGISLFSFLTPRKEIKQNKNNKFAVLVAAHNEEKVISGILKSLDELNYPKNMYSVFVIADNCTDKTAEIAKSFGVRVIERCDANKKGKGYALEYAFDYIFKIDEEFEYVSVFDADNIVDKDFLYHINNKINTGARAVQGYLDSKNPYDSWLTFSYSLWYWLSNRLSQLSRDNIGFGARLGGTGLAIDLELIKKFGWGATCLAEDTEFTLKLAMEDISVAWEHNAVVYDEKPLGLETSWNQRMRWAQGINDAFGKYIKPLLKKSVKEKNLKPFHMVMNLLGDSLYPACIGVMCFIYILTIIGRIKPELSLVLCSFWTQPINYALLKGYVFANLGMALYALYIDGKLTKEIFKNIFGFIFYLISWIPIGISSLFKKNDGEWFHTPHSSDKK